MTRQSLSIYHDGEFPVCSHYVRHSRLRKSIDVSLIDLRTEPEKVASFNAIGLNVDEGMIVIFDCSTYHGAEAMHVLALLSTPSGFVNYCNRIFFSRRWLATVMYPLLVGGRNLLLLVLGRKKINAT